MKTVKVNLIEDDPDDTLIIQDMLTGNNDLHFQVKAARTVGAGVEMLKQELPDLVLLDLSLPDTMGLEGLRLVRAAAPDTDLIILTGNNDNRMGVEALKQGASDYLVKGRIDSNLLVRTILFTQERRKLEEQLRQAQKVEAIGKLAGGIAHDFNNQLGIMTLLVSEISSANTNTNIAVSLKNLSSVIEKCGRLVSQILAFSRKQVLLAEPLDVNKVLEELMPLMQRMVGALIQVKFEPDRNPCVLKLDKNQFEQVLWNLVINAKDAIARQGNITVRTRIEKAENKERVVIEVEDDGPGIPKEILSKIFDPFFTTKPIGEGTGLGLATVSGIIHQSNGGIDVLTEEGKGTCFKMWFPLWGEELAVKGPAEKTAAFGKKTVIVCDDEEMLLDLMSAILEDNGINVLRASSAAKALELYKNNPGVDLVITDLTMPVMDGKTLGKELEKISPEVKIIYISGFSNTTNNGDDLVPNSRYLAKPFTKPALLGAVNEMLHTKT